MDRIQVSQIKKQASGILQKRSPEFRKTVLLHGAVMVVFLLLTAVVSFLLNRAMADNQGLSGMKTTAILRTVQFMLTMTGNILMPFWEIGLLYTAIRAVRGKSTDFSLLTQGFTRFAVVLRYFVLYLLILLVVGLVCSNLLMSLTMFLPTPPSISNALGTIDPTTYTDYQVMLEDIMQALSQVPRSQLLLYFVPLGIFYLAGYFTVILLLSYRFRMSRYLLMDDKPVRARQALGISNRITRGEKSNLLVLDLSFWWYYLLQIGVAAIVYIPDILVAAGVNLPISQNVANLLAYVVYCACSLVVMWFAGAYYHTAMACAYEALKPVVDADSQNG